MAVGLIMEVSFLKIGGCEYPLTKKNIPQEKELRIN